MAKLWMRRTLIAASMLAPAAASGQGAAPDATAPQAALPPTVSKPARLILKGRATDYVAIDPTLCL